MISIQQSTKQGYVTVQRLLAKEAFGKKTIRSVKTSDAKLFLIKLQQEDGKSYSSIHTIRGVLRPAFQMAVDDDILVKNPFGFQLAGVLVNDAVTREAVTKEQMRKFLKFVHDDVVYLYSILTNTNTMRFGDTMPAFARIITEQVKDGNILLRLDERLALPINQAISYSTLNFEKYRGPQFHFKDSILKNPKTITIHIDENTADKLLLVVKRKVDNNSKKDFWHIELETLPYRDTALKGKYCITTFLHGMYYPEDDCFTHIDCTKNQYEMSEYIKKYSECEPDIPVDLHTKSNELHYKIWCIENGRYTREVWYNLMTASLNEKYRTLLDEILA